MFQLNESVAACLYISINCQLFVVGFDGTGLTRLTPEDATHSVSIGADTFVDTYSRVDLPPVTVLRKLDGTYVMELEKADVSELMGLGYQMPERFTVTAADGVTSYTVSWLNRLILTQTKRIR